MSCQFKKDKTGKPEPDNAQSPTSEIQSEKSKTDTLFNTKDFLIIGDKSDQIKIVTKDELDNFPAFKTLTAYHSKVVIGKNVTLDDITVYKKYNPKTSFQDYPAEVFKGSLADPDFTTNPDAKSFITRIKETCAEGINFAGHYTLVIWGCGTSCQSSVLVDRKTGRIFDGYVTSLGSEFRKDSNMIIKNVGAIDESTMLLEGCDYCEVSQEIWTGTTFKEVE